MSVIRKIEITNFRCLKSFSWQPQPGINCLIGPGDSGKSTILDAIDYCLGARRNLQLADTDFHYLDVSQPINITSGRSVGSTLTLKGLEADAAVILDASGLNARNLYVAMTRGAKRLVICSRKATLNPSW